MKPHPAGYTIKLVRDNTEAIINPSGEPGDLWYDEATGDVTRLLRLKLAEELGEYLVDGGVAELTDVIAVIEALALRYHDMPLERLIAIMRKDDRGGFLRGRVMYGRHPEYDR